MPQPVFIAASVRSGSTMLKLMLDHHPDILNPGECDFLFDYVGDDESLPDPLTYEVALRLDRIYQAQCLSLDAALSYPEIMESFVHQLAKEQACLTMNVHRNFHRIPHVFPDARYIHLVRDPRDVARSCVALGWAGHVYYGVDIWKAAEDSWARLRESLNPQQFIEIRYEDFLGNVEAGLTDICEFLGLQYSRAMLSYADNSSYDLPDARLCYQWKTKLSNRELQLVEGKIMGQIINYGYALSDNESRLPGLFERIALKFTSKTKRANYQVKKYGAHLYLLMLLANRVHIGLLSDFCQRHKNRIDRHDLK